MDVLGYLAYIAFVFLPGLAVCEILLIFEGRESLTERIALAFGMGLAADTLVMAIRTSGFGSLKGMDVGTVEGVIVVGAVALVVPVAMRRRLSFPIKPKLVDYGVFVSMAVLALLILVYLQKYPIFPEYYSYDFQGHLLNTQNIVSGAYTTFPAGILYYGVHYQLGAAFLLTGDNILESVRTTMSILVVLSVPLVYLATFRLFSRVKTAFVAVLLYVLSGSIWFVSVFNAGLFPNFFGIMIALLVITLFLDTQAAHGWRPWAALIVVLPAMYLSHYTIITIIPPMLAVALLQAYRARKNWKRLVLPAVAILAPMIIAAVAFRSVVSVLLSLLSLQGGTLTGGTSLSGALSGFPVLSYMAAEFYYDIGFVLMWVFVAIYVWKLVPSLFSPVVIPLLWLLTLFVSSPFGLISWRFALEALVPFTLMGAYGISAIVPKLRQKRKGKGLELASYWRAGLVLALVLGVTVGGSWGQAMVSDATTETSAVSASQVSVYNAIQWINTNTPSNATFFSVSDWRFTYTAYLIDRTTSYQFESTPAQALAYVNGTSIGYIIVTNAVTVSLPPDPSLFPWNNFPSNSTSSLALVFTNSDVRIYHILT